MGVLDVSAKAVGADAVDDYEVVREAVECVAVPDGEYVFDAVVHKWGVGQGA